MATLTTKFNVGDVVWRPHARQIDITHPCPDCLGLGKWQAISPGGRGYLFACPRCSRWASSDARIGLMDSRWEPHASRLTIGSVGFSPEDGPRYMCVETGIGSGNVYYEHDLFESEDAAMTAAKAECEINAAKRAEDRAKNPSRWANNLEVRQYQMDLALVEDTEQRMRRFGYKVGDLLDEIGDELACDFRSRNELEQRIRRIIGKHFPDHSAAEEAPADEIA